jgi:hypothetical protein
MNTIKKITTIAAIIATIGSASAAFAFPPDPWCPDSYCPSHHHIKVD